MNNWQIYNNSVYSLKKKNIICSIDIFVLGVIYFLEYIEIVSSIGTYSEQ